MKLEEIKKAIEELTDAEKRQFFSEMIPEVCTANQQGYPCYEPIPDYGFTGQKGFR
jgi:hypothetical protein